MGIVRYQEPLPMNPEGFTALHNTSRELISNRDL